MNVLEIVREEAGKRFSTEAEIDAFMDGFEKQAGFGLFNSGAITQLMGNPKVQEAAAKAGFGLAAGLVGAAVVKGFNFSGAAITNNTLKSKFESSLTFVSNNNKIVKNANPTKVKSYANTLFSFAPNVSSDPNLLSSLLANAVLGEGIDPMTIKAITDLEGRYTENIAPKPLIGMRV